MYFHWLWHNSLDILVLLRWKSFGRVHYSRPTLMQKVTPTDLFFFYFIFISFLLPKINPFLTINDNRELVI